MTNYPQVRLGDVCESVSITHKLKQDKIILVNTSDVFDGKVTNHNYVENKNLRGQFKKRFKRNDILYSEIRPKNKRFAFVDFEAMDYVASTKLMAIRAYDNILPIFLFQILKNDNLLDRLQVLAETRSGTFPQI
ncbi:MAG: restriction endonuclease subunit S, partial [Bacteroidales bacterium]|nr:restriction endonuclease subunit S [Bacteroidales bacterium]